MKRLLISTMMVLAFGTAFTSCNKDDDEVEQIEQKDANLEELEFKSSSQKGHFIDGEVMIKGLFDRDTVVTGFNKFVKCSSTYCNKDGEEIEKDLGYFIVVNMPGMASYYSDSITYNVDSSAVSCKGYLELFGENELTSNAIITAEIDSVGKPHHATCYTKIRNKNVVFQFREIHHLSPYDVGVLPPDDQFTISSPIEKLIK
ncbi:MAG: hypothetical protein PUC50_06430 [Bacteroidales bacterium]|nr:hypothetical protein [Bacteroidales bacterium]